MAQLYPDQPVAEDSDTPHADVINSHSHKRDYNELFPGCFKNEADIVRGPSVAKLRGDDLLITRELVNKHGDNIKAMTRDIKLNYMQWSKSVVAKMHKAYFAHGHDQIEQ